MRLLKYLSVVLGLAFSLCILFTALRNEEYKYISFQLFFAIMALMILSNLLHIVFISKEMKYEFSKVNLNRSQRVGLRIPILGFLFMTRLIDAVQSRFGLSGKGKFSFLNKGVLLVVFYISFVPALAYAISAFTFFTWLFTLSLFQVLYLDGIMKIIRGQEYVEPNPD